jgi:hypothetical protein
MTFAVRLFRSTHFSFFSFVVVVVLDTHNKYPELVCPYSLHHHLFVPLLLSVSLCCPLFVPRQLEYKLSLLEARKSKTCYITTSISLRISSNVEGALPLKPDEKSRRESNPYSVGSLSLSRDVCTRYTISLSEVGKKSLFPSKIF